MDPGGGAAGLAKLRCVLLGGGGWGPAAVCRGSLPVEEPIKLEGLC